jgi:hypothetical protein
MISIYLSGGRVQQQDESVFVAGLPKARQSLAAPFSKVRLELASRVGARVLRGAKAGVSPAVVHFAYWTRAAALRKLADGFEVGTPAGCMARPSGLVFHLPPQNVETVFLYSWMLSYLAGNANVVRLPSALGPEMRALLDLFLKEFETVGEQGQLFVNYASDSQASIAISAQSDARVVWGGDAKVETFARIPLRNGGKALWFGDRFSFSVVDGAQLATLDDDTRLELAANLANDLYIFDQMACSSPHVLYVVGGREKHRAAVEALFQAVVTVVREKHLEPATGHAIRKMVEAFAAVGRGEAESIYWRDNLLTAAEISVAATPSRRVGGGYLEYHFLSALEDILPLIREHDQTLTYFGFGYQEMADLMARRVATGITRVVPVGQALDFDFIWDGYDLPRELTRLVRVL